MPLGASAEHRSEIQTQKNHKIHLFYQDSPQLAYKELQDNKEIKKSLKTNLEIFSDSIKCRINRIAN